MENSYTRQLLTSTRNLKDFSRQTKVPYQTLMDIKRGRTKVDNMGVGNFIKIAHGLGMTADELYYGDPDSNVIEIDPLREGIKDVYSSVSDAGRNALYSYATKVVASDYAAKTEADEDSTIPHAVNE